MLRYALVAGLLLGSSAQAQLRIASLPDVYESYNDCFSATEEGIDLAALESLGWKRATMQSGNGEPIADGPIIYGHAERAPVILFSGAEGKGVCVVTARLKDIEQFKKFKSVWGDALPQPNDEGEIWFMAEGRMVQMALTGSREEPSVRLIVATPSESE